MPPARHQPRASHGIRYARQHHGLQIAVTERPSRSKERTRPRVESRVRHGFDHDDLQRYRYRGARLIGRSRPDRHGQRNVRTRRIGRSGVVGLDGGRAGGGPDGLRGSAQGLHPLREARRSPDRRQAGRCRGRHSGRSADPAPGAQHLRPQPQLHGLARRHRTAPRHRSSAPPRPPGQTRDFGRERPTRPIPTRIEPRSWRSTATPAARR